MKLILSAKNLQNITQPNENPKSKRDTVIILGDSMIKHTNG